MGSWESNVLSGFYDCPYCVSEDDEDYDDLDEEDYEAD